MKFEVKDERFVKYLQEGGVAPEAAPAEAAPKKLKRGVSNQTQAVNQLKFHEKDAAQNGLFVGHLDTVSLTKGF